MKIKIITTEKKLTTSILKQMYTLPYGLFDKAEILGYISVSFTKERGIKKALCKVGDEYYLLDLRFERRGTYAGYNGNFKGERTIRFKVDIIDDWFQKYEKIKTEADKKGHIYI